jgi:phospholipase C
MRCNPLTSRAIAIAALGLIFSACNGNGGVTSTNPGLPTTTLQRAPLQFSLQPLHHHRTSGKIQHVVIIMQENRSFNNLFYGFPGAKTSKYGYDSNGNKIKLLPVGLETRWDLDHSSTAFFQACNGTGSIPGTNCQMNGFNKIYAGCGSNGDPCPIPHPQYAYVPHSETMPYFAMGEQYVLADQMYASNFDASSFISHQYIISGQAESAVNFPYGAWGCPGGSGDMIGEVNQQRQVDTGYEVVCWDPTTLGDELDTAKISWGFYGQFYSNQPWLWIAYQAIKHIYYGADWKNDIFSPPSQVLTDISNGNLRAVNWVTPTWTNSDHAGSGSNTGPAWVTSVVNAIGQSKYWDSTAIFIFWDDFGGWYDREPPAYVDYDGLGLRLPLLIVSPYAKKGYVSHVHYEHGSILKFIEDQFGLGRLSASDTRANSPAQDAFDFNQPPRKFKVIPAAYGKDYFLHQAPDNHIPDTQ